MIVGPIHNFSLVGDVINDFDTQKWYNLQSGRSRKELIFGIALFSEQTVPLIDFSTFSNDTSTIIKIGNQKDAARWRLYSNSDHPKSQVQFVNCKL
jgi:hypothetical protein